MKIVKKISTATLEVALTKDKKAVVAASDTPVFMGRILGVATGVKKGVTQYGTWAGLTGNFRGVDPDGEISMAPFAFIPGGYHELVVAEMGQITWAGDEGAAEKSVTFAFDVFASKSKGEKGYQYSLSPAGEFKDPMADAMAGLAQLPKNSAQLRLAMNEQTVEPVAAEPAAGETGMQKAAKLKK